VLEPLFKAACAGPALEFVFVTPPSCIVAIDLYFKDDAAPGERVFALTLNGVIINGASSCGGSSARCVTARSGSCAAALRLHCAQLRGLWRGRAAL